MKRILVTITIIPSFLFLAACNDLLRPLSNGEAVQSPNSGAGQNVTQSTSVQSGPISLTPVIKDKTNNTAGSLLQIVTGYSDGTAALVYNPEGDLLIVYLHDGSIIKEALYFTSEDCSGDTAYIIKGSWAIIERVARSYDNRYYKMSGYANVRVYSMLNFDGNCLYNNTWDTDMMGEMTLMEKQPSDFSAYAPLHFVIQ
ncbi:MAG: hypothetical protein WCQ53_00185 [bacterium]